MYKTRFFWKHNLKNNITTFPFEALLSSCMGQKIDQLPFLTSTEIPYQLGGWVAGSKLGPLEATKHTLNRCIYIQKHLQLQCIAVHHRIQHTHTLLSLCKMPMHTLHNCLQTFDFHPSSLAAFFLGWILATICLMSQASSRLYIHPRKSKSTKRLAHW